VTHFVTPGRFEVFGNGLFGTVLRNPEGTLRNSHATVRNFQATIEFLALLILAKSCLCAIEREKDHGKAVAECLR